MLLSKHKSKETIAKALQQFYNRGIASGLIVGIDTMAATQEGTTEPLHALALSHGLTGLAYGGLYGIVLAIEAMVIGYKRYKGEITKFESVFRLGKCTARLFAGWGTAKSGFMAGGLIGSAAGPIGITAGAIIGAIVGGVAGSALTSWLAETKVWPWLQNKFPHLAEPEQVKQELYTIYIIQSTHACSNCNSI